jgi:phosphoglycolate phosphatase-like HAD superfamily hydrolase
VRKYILVDVDHTLANSFYRDGLMAAPMGAGVSWDEYHAASAKDEPIQDIVMMINSLAMAGYTIVVLTARPGKWRQLTMDWLLRIGVHVDELLMRPDDDYHPAPAMKTALALERFGNDLKEKVAFILDDREDVIAAFKALGITALQVNGRQM